MSEKKKRGSSRGTVSWKRDSITSPPTRRSGINSVSPPTRRSGINSVSPPTRRSGINSVSPPTRKSSRNSMSPPTRRSGKNSVSPPTRRSGRNSASLTKSTDTPIPAPVVKLSITAKKIMPRKTLAALASAESQPKTASSVQQTTAVLATPKYTPKASSVAPALRRSSRTSPSSEKENEVLDKSQGVPNGAKDQLSVSEIDVLSPIPLNVPHSPSYDDRAKLMSQKVRRSYSRLEMSMNGGSFLYSPTRDTDSSDTSTPNPAPKAGRRSLFGFDKLFSSDSPEEEAEHKRDGEGSKQKNSASAMSVRLSSEEPDPNIPGVALAKQKRRKRKIPQIEKSDLDEWAATMNAQFEEAERFDLVVE